MHNIELIKKNKKLFDSSMERRALYSCSQEILFIDKIVQNSKRQINNLQYIKNNIAKQIALQSLKNIDFYHLKIIGLNTKSKLRILEKQKNEAEESLNSFLISLPNNIEESVPYGVDENDNKILKIFGRTAIFNFIIHSHYEIGERLQLMDFKNATILSGARFVILRKDFAKLERALISFIMHHHTKTNTFEEISPPVLVSEEIMFKTGQLPKFEKDSFKTSSGHRLIPTSEIPLVCMAMNKIINEKQLPKRYTGYTQCFRSEAGSAGQDTKGMIRQRQFLKVELVSVTTPDQSLNELEIIIHAAEIILQKLEIPYRVSLLCSQDTGFCSQKTYDIEVWLPYQKKYTEISSCSNCGSFQARRIESKYKSLKGNKNYYTHTLNGSGLAIGRTIVAIIENYQNKDGVVLIPKKLQYFMQNQKVINKND